MTERDARTAFEFQGFAQAQETPRPARRVQWAAGRRRVSRWWAGVPLVGRLIGIFTALLALGLLLAGISAATLLNRTLVAQVNEKLTTEGKSLAQNLVNNPFGSGSLDGYPTDYYLRIVGSNGVPSSYAARTTLQTYGTPSLTTPSQQQAIDDAGVTFTVSSDLPGSHWQFVVYPVSQNDQYIGAVAVGLPLGGINDTVRRMVLVLLCSGLAIAVVGAFVARWSVRRSLQPLREIEQTAAAIAAGDLSQRVPRRPEHTEVGRLGASLNGMLAQIEQAFAVRTASEARMRRFVADASHELRTPLATIRGYAELYRMGATTSPDDVADTMRRIEGSATRMGTLVEDLLLLARLDEGRPVAAEPVDLTVLAADAVSDLHALDPERPARLVPLDATASGGPVVVTGDDARLRQVVANLVGNVVRHTPAGTPVEIAVGATDGVGVLEVRDHGPGIDPAHAARVFERFYRVDASRTRESGGAGLGMAIVAAIVAAHRGEVSITETPGGGTTVRVVVPSGPSSN